MWVSEGANAIGAVTSTDLFLSLRLFLCSLVRLIPTFGACHPHQPTLVLTRAADDSSIDTFCDHRHSFRRPDSTPLMYGQLLCLLVLLPTSGPSRGRIPIHEAPPAFIAAATEANSGTRAGPLVSHRTSYLFGVCLISSIFGS